MLITNDNKTTSPRLQTKGFLLSHKNNSQSLIPPAKSNRENKICSLCRRQCAPFSRPTSWVPFFCRTMIFDAYKKSKSTSIAASLAGQHVRDLLLLRPHQSTTFTNTQTPEAPLIPLCHRMIDRF
jgi:hypothetical protein